MITHSFDGSIRCKPQSERQEDNRRTVCQINCCLPTLRLLGVSLEKFRIHGARNGLMSTPASHESTRRRGGEKAHFPQTVRAMGGAATCESGERHGGVKFFLSGAGSGPIEGLVERRGKVRPASRGRRCECEI
jgi:hypothetical protein